MSRQDEMRNVVESDLTRVFLLQIFSPVFLVAVSLTAMFLVVIFLSVVLRASIDVLLSIWISISIFNMIINNITCILVPLPPLGRLLILPLFRLQSVPFLLYALYDCSLCPILWRRVPVSCFLDEFFVSDRPELGEPDVSVGCACGSGRRL